MSPRTIILGTMLIAAAIGSWYLARSGTPAEVRSLPIDPAYHGYYLKQARILGTGDDGKLLYEIEALHAEQQEDLRIEFRDVRIRYSPESEVPWLVNADEATLREGNPQIELRGHVQVLGNTGEENETEVRTEYLEFNPDQFVASTEDRVQIRFGSRSLTATGMLASLQDDKIELKSNVRGKIVP